MKPNSLLLALALAGCYSPNLDGVHYTCHDDAPLCPTGLVCRGSLCVTPGAGSESTDLAVSDGAVWGMQTQADMVYAWDPSAKPGPVPGCKKGIGYKLTDRAYACPAPLFQIGDLSAQCAQPFMVCSQPPVPAEACAAIPWGFFASLAVGYQSPTLIPPTDGSLDCSWNTGQNDRGSRGLFGCGQNASSGAALAQPNTCGAFGTVVGCLNGNIGTSWNCPVVGAEPAPSDFAAITNSDSSSGVLCCR